MSLAQLENNDLAEGSIIEPVDGENKMVHLRDHVEELVAGLEEVNQGNVDLAEWTMRNIPLYRHCVDTLEQTSVHESMIPELNSIRQQIQQAGEVIDNGLRHINKLRDDQGDMSQGAQEGADQEGAQAQQEGATQEETSSEKDSDIKNAKMFAEAQAKIEVMRMMSKAKTDNMQAESMAKIISMDAQTAADIKRKEILARAST